jgi:nucleotide-binding universal stress UspA family protein
MVLGNFGGSPYASSGAKTAHPALRGSERFESCGVSKRPAVDGAALSADHNVPPTQPRACPEPDLRTEQPSAGHEPRPGTGQHPLSKILQALPRCGGKRRAEPGGPSVGGATASYSQGDCRSAVLASLCRVGKNILNKAEAIVRERGLATDCLLFESGSGSAANVILEQARLWGASLIVLGAHTPGARGRIRRLIRRDCRFRGSGPHGAWSSDGHE